MQCFPSSERGIRRGHRVTAGVVEHPPCAAPSHAVIGARICQYAVQLALGGSVVAQSGRHSQVGQRRRSDALRRVDAGKLLQAPPELRRRIDDPGIEIIGAIKVVSTSKQLDCTAATTDPTSLQGSAVPCLVLGFGLFPQRCDREVQPVGQLAMGIAGHDGRMQTQFD